MVDAKWYREWRHKRGISKKHNAMLGISYTLVQTS
jgi:hypothetical protein